jgi:rhodanese-related sulfurtransferase
MVAAARARITNLSQTDFERERAGGEAVLIDVRDVRERWRDGTIPGARHVPRGMIEFWADPESKYHKDYLSPERRVILFCAAGMLYLV